MTAGISYTLWIDGMPPDAALLEAVQEVQVEQHSELAAIFRLRIAVGVTGTGEWSVLQDEPFKPLTPVRISAQVGTLPGEVLIDGYVTEIRADLREEPGVSVLEVVGMDATVLMNLEEKVTRWANMADSDIAAVILLSYGLVPKVEQTQPIRTEEDLTIIQRETDIRFLRRLARRNGFLCGVEPEPLTGMPFGLFGPPDLQGQPQGVLSVNMATETNVAGFSVRYDMLAPVAAKAAGVAGADKSELEAEAAEVSEQTLGRESTLAALQRAAESARVLAVSSMADGADLNALAKSLADRSAWAVTAEGELIPGVYGGILRPNRTVNVRGAGATFSGTYFVTRVLHRFTRSEGYGAQFTLKRNGLGLTGTESFLGA